VVHRRKKTTPIITSKGGREVVQNGKKGRLKESFLSWAHVKHGERGKLNWGKKNEKNEGLVKFMWNLGQFIWGNGWFARP